MIEISEDTPADTLMQTYLDQNVGPIIMTNDMQELGLENTFMAGYFYNGAPLLQRYLTPAKSTSGLRYRSGCVQPDPPRPTWA